MTTSSLQENFRMSKQFHQPYKIHLEMSPVSYLNFKGAKQSILEDSQHSK